MKVILDTNVIASGIFWGGKPYQVIDRLVRNDFNLVLSKEILDEYNKTIARLSEKYLKTNIDQILEVFLFDAIFVVPHLKNTEIPYCKDPDDVKFLSAAIEGKANFIVSGDKHLLDVVAYSNGCVLTPDQFLKRLDEI